MCARLTIVYCGERDVGRDVGAVDRVDSSDREQSTRALHVIVPIDKLKTVPINEIN